MSCILSIETSTDVCSVAVSEDSQTIFSQEDHSGPNHSVTLGVFVDEALSFIDSHAIPLDAVAVSCGPGSYTGLRIGVSMAKGICYGLNIPLLSVPTLELLAVPVLLREMVKEEDALLCPMLDARRMEVYAGIYTRALKPVRPVQADVVGDMPMTVRLEPVAINENGEVLNDVKLTIDGKSFVEVPGDDRTTILVTLTATGGKRVSDFVNRDVNYFDGIRFDFTLLKPTQPGAKIFSDMKVRLEDMKMGIIGAGYDGN